MPDTVSFPNEPILGSIEVRDVELREVVGRFVNYGQTILVRGKPESFARGAFAGVDAAKVKLFSQHSHEAGRQPIGKMVELEERDDGAYGKFKIAKTAAGDEMLALVTEGVIDSFSIGFIPGNQSASGVHTRVKALPEVSLVSFPAYAGTQVISVRDKNSTEEQMPDTDVVDAPVAVDLEPLETRISDLSNQIERLQSAVDAPPVNGTARGIRPVEWFAAELDVAFNNRFERREKVEEKWNAYKTSSPDSLHDLLETRALSDITGTLGGGANDLSALVLEEFIASQLVDVLDTRRPLFRRLGSFPLPRSGSARIPVVTQHSLVTERPTQKAAAGSRTIKMTSAPFEAIWYSGALDVSLELIRTAELPILNFVFNDLLGQYAIVTEAAVVTYFNSAASHASVGAVLDTTSYADFVLQLATEAIEVRKSSGVAATALAVTEAQWPVILSMMDLDGRRVLATNSPSNADGSAGLQAESFNLAGIDVFYVPDLDHAVLFNQEAIKAADGGPEQVGPVTNVELMGQDVGVLGRTMIVPRIPGAIRAFVA